MHHFCKHSQRPRGMTLITPFWVRYDPYTRHHCHCCNPSPLSAAVRLLSPCRLLVDVWVGLCALASLHHCSRCKQTYFCAAMGAGLLIPPSPANGSSRPTRLLLLLLEPLLVLLPLLLLTGARTGVDTVLLATGGRGIPWPRPPGDDARAGLVLSAWC